MNKTEKVLLGFAIGTIVGAIAGSIVGSRPPFTLNPPGGETPLDMADRGLATAAGAWVGEIAGTMIAVASF